MHSGSALSVARSSDQQDTSHMGHKGQHTAGEDQQATVCFNFKSNWFASATVLASAEAWNGISRGTVQVHHDEATKDQRAHEVKTSEALTR